MKKLIALLILVGFLAVSTGCPSATTPGKDKDKAPEKEKDKKPS